MSSSFPHISSQLTLLHLTSFSSCLISLSSFTSLSSCLISLFSFTSLSSCLISLSLPSLHLTSFSCLISLTSFTLHTLLHLMSDPSSSPKLSCYYSISSNSIITSHISPYLTPHLSSSKFQVTLSSKLTFTLALTSSFLTSHLHSLLISDYTTSPLSLSFLPSSLSSSHLFPSRLSSLFLLHISPHITFCTLPISSLPFFTYLLTLSFLYISPHSFLSLSSCQHITSSLKLHISITYSRLIQGILLHIPPHFNFVSHF